ncbi:L,D-transpeptidase family protein [Sulfitobacter sp. D35]|uniref:L,D-transpeptidase family protein n=1 Tax=Sulfitobacter sp. D35 TaxID=3083252 RepID=UPI00296FB72A|nr:L,D-transpeptidase family protein [Sulfitobacter sp. D35]MDW4498043.1 L,D-transpeptidase family protein [Sulfitobacter sp. D35]
MRRRDLLMGATAMVTLGACSGDPKFKRYSGPEVTYVVVNKNERRMYLLHHDQVLKSYDVNLGWAPVGHKIRQGDGKTPEGRYTIDRRNPNSKYHLSVGISYPNDKDREIADALGYRTGGDIFIHGQEKPNRKDKKDWTWGCIAVRNREIEDVYAMVRDGTPITINP